MTFNLPWDRFQVGPRKLIDNPCFQLKPGTITHIFLYISILINFIFPQLVLERATKGKVIYYLESWRHLREIEFMFFIPFQVFFGEDMKLLDGDKISRINSGTKRVFLFGRQKKWEQKIMLIVWWAPSSLVSYQLIAC